MTAENGPARFEGVWMPTGRYREHSRMAAFLRDMGVASVRDLDTMARREPAAFWAAVEAWLGLPWMQPYREVLDQTEDAAATRWFLDGEFNIFDAAVDRWVRAGRGSDVALTRTDELGNLQQLTFDDLAASVRDLASRLASLGLRKGDRVGIQLPMRCEVAIVQLAVAYLGAITVPIFSGFASGATSDRLNRSSATMFICATHLTRRGRHIDLAEHHSAVRANVPSLNHLLLVDGLSGDIAVSGPEGRRGVDAVPIARCSSDDPLMIAYTSGTTGAPKGVLLDHAGFTIKAASDVALYFDAGPSDTIAWYTDPGWVMHPITLIGGLVAGATVALIDGAFDYPERDRLWRDVETLGITILGVSPTLVRSMMAVGALPERPLSDLRVFASSGEPWTSDAYMWLFQQVGKGAMPIINYSGGTEVSGAILANTPTEPIHPCAFNASVAGMGADVVDADGSPVNSGVGELVLRSPSPGMPLGFWGEPGRYRSTYWADWPNTWRHGDWVELGTAGQYFVRGRSDDTLKIAGKRIGPAEIEEIVNGNPAIAESAAIGVPHPIKGETLVVIAVTTHRLAEQDDLRANLAEAIAATFGKPLRPSKIEFVDELPKTRSGKIVRRAIRASYVGDAVGDLSGLDNPGALDKVASLT
jgi:acetyl-CoA synthetase